MPSGQAAFRYYEAFLLAMICKQRHYRAIRGILRPATSQNSPFRTGSFDRLRTSTIAGAKTPAVSQAEVPEKSLGSCAIAAYPEKALLWLEVMQFFPLSPWTQDQQNTSAASNQSEVWQKQGRGPEQYQGGKFGAPCTCS